MRGAWVVVCGGAPSSAAGAMVVAVVLGGAFGVGFGFGDWMVGRIAFIATVEGGFGVVFCFVAACTRLASSSSFSFSPSLSSRVCWCQWGRRVGA